MAKFFYRTNTSSDLGKKLRNLLYECDKANRAADTYCAKSGAKTFYADERQMAGGVLCVGFGDQKPDKKLWRSVGKDGDGLEMFEPNCQRIQDCIILPRRDFRPSDTATRIYNKRLSKWPEVINLHSREEWQQLAAITPTGDPDRDWQRAEKKLQDEIYVRYVELYYNKEQRQLTLTEPRYRMPLYMRRAIHLELQRIKLPVVSIQSVYQLLHVNLTDGMTDSQRLRIVQPVTPIIFEHYGRYYVGCDYPCQHPDLETIEEGKFNIKLGEFKAIIQQQPS